MKTTTRKIRNTAIVALLSFPVMVVPSLAQSTDGTQTQGSDQQGDKVVATVDGEEISGSDVMTFIGMLPPDLQSQPPQMLVPMAVDQLILRELILQEGRAQNLADDPEVLALVAGSARPAEDDAIMQVWLDRELAGAVTDEAVQQAYDQAQADGALALPPVEDVRGEIEQFLRQQAMREIQIELTQGADIVLFDPTGRPMEPGATRHGQDSDSSDSSQSGTHSGTSSESSGSDSN